MPEVRNPRYIPPEEDFWKVYALAEGQDQVMLLTVLHLAPRRGEVFRMEWSDVDFINNRVRLWTRKRKDGAYEYDWLPMTKDLRNSLRWWWEHRPIKDKPHVFLCLEETEFTQEYYGQPFKIRLQFMRRLCERAKVPRFGFHAIRHLSASILFNAGYDLGVIQAILRHQSPSTTERYLKSIGMERVRDALESLPSKPAEVVKIDEVKERVMGE
jgi:integrase